MYAHFVGTEEEQRRIRPYVSNRELTAETPLAIFPLGFDNRPKALLLVAASPYLSEAPSLLSVIVSAINDSATELLQMHRDRRLDAVRNRAVFTAHELNTNPGDVLSGQEAPLALVRVAGESLLRLVHKQFAEADRFRVKQDLARIVGAVIADLGIVVDLPDDSLLAILSKADRVDLALLERHLDMVVRQVFIDVSADFDLPMESRVQGEESPEEFARAYV